MTVEALRKLSEQLSAVSNRPIKIIHQPSSSTKQSDQQITLSSKSIPALRQAIVSRVTLSSNDIRDTLQNHQQTSAATVPNSVDLTPQSSGRSTPSDTSQVYI